METLMYAVIPMLWAVSLIAVIVSLLSLLIKKARGKETKKTKRRLAFAAGLVLVTFIVIGTYMPEGESEDKPVVADKVGGEDREPDMVEPEPEVEIGSAKENPFVLTADELAAEINADIDAAKAKYNGKWVKITGTVTDYSRYSADDLSGYYLYGNYGVEGLRIVCWQNKGAWKQNEKIGDVCTCVGQVREITTFNATEIGDCEITFE